MRSCTQNPETDLEVVISPPTYLRCTEFLYFWKKIVAERRDSSRRRKRAQPTAGRVTVGRPVCGGVRLPSRLHECGVCDRFLADERPNDIQPARQFKPQLRRGVQRPGQVDIRDQDDSDGSDSVDPESVQLRHGGLRRGPLGRWHIV